VLIKWDKGHDIHPTGIQTNLNVLCRYMRLTFHTFITQNERTRTALQYKSLFPARNSTGGTIYVHIDTSPSPEIPVQKHNNNNNPHI